MSGITEAFQTNNLGLNPPATEKCKRTHDSVLLTSTFHLFYHIRDDHLSLYQAKTWSLKVFIEKEWLNENIHFSKYDTLIRVSHSTLDGV